MSAKLDGKIALVTGGNSGIGLAIAKRFAREGAFVFITGRRKNELEKAAKLNGPEPAAIQADVSNLSDLDRVYEEIRSRKGRLDILVANAGGGTFAPLGAITEEHYDQTFDQREGILIHSSQTSSSALGRSFNHLDWIDGGQRRDRCIWSLCRNEGSHTILRAELGDGPQGAEDTCECN